MELKWLWALAKRYIFSSTGYDAARCNYALRVLPECDRNSTVAQAMTLRQREIYFRCIDLAEGGGFEYQGGSLGGGSMTFCRNETIQQRFSLYVGASEVINIGADLACYSNALSDEQLIKVGTYARIRMMELIHALLRLRPEDQLVTLDGSCVVRLDERGASFCIESHFEHVRTHLAMVLDLCDIVERYASRFITLNSKRSNCKGTSSTLSCELN